MTTYFKEYRAIMFPQWAIDLGFKDVSWHNDAMPHCTIELKGPEVTPLILELWVDYEDREQREVPSWPRYMAGLAWEEQRSEGFLVNIYHGEAENDCRYLVEKFVALLRRRS